MSKITKGMFTSNSDDWPTPQAFFDGLNERMKFTLDACASAENAKCDRFFTKEQDGLKQDWTTGGTVWVNPPYGREIGKWVRKAYDESRPGRANRVAVLVPARTETVWWNDYVMKADEVWFVKGRLTFGKATKACTFPNAVAFFNPGSGMKIFGTLDRSGREVSSWRCQDDSLWRPYLPRAA